MATNSINTPQVQAEVTQPLSTEVSLTPDETSVVNSKEFKDWFGKQDGSFSRVLETQDTRTREGTGDTGGTTNRSGELSGVQQTGENISLLQSGRDGVEGTAISGNVSRGDDSTGVDSRTESPQSENTGTNDSRQDGRRNVQPTKSDTPNKGVSETLPKTQRIEGKPYTGNVATKVDGTPQLWFHGTSGDFTEFDLNHTDRKDTGWLGTGVYLTDSERHANDVC